MKTITLTIITTLFISCSIEKKADRGDISACYSVVEKNNNWYHNPPDKKQQEKIIKYSLKAIELDTGNYFGSFFYYHLAQNITDEKARYNYYKKAAELDDGASQWITGLNYLEGRTVTKDNDSALYWITKASNGTDLYYAAIATKEIGDFYRTGQIVKTDSLLSLYYYKKACACYEQSGSLPACDSVIAYYTRRGNSSDTTEIAIYKELARQKRRNISWK